MRRVEHRPIPVVLSHPPALFDWMVCAVLWRILCQTDRDMRAFHTCEDTLQTRGTPAVLLWTIVHRDEQRLAMRNAPTNDLPPLDETIPPTLTGHVGGHSREKPRIGGREDHPHWGDGCRWWNVVISSPGLNATFPCASTEATVKGGPGIHRDPSPLRSGIRVFIQERDLCKESVGFRAFFLGGSWAPSSESLPTHSAWSHSSPPSGIRLRESLCGHATGDARPSSSRGCAGGSCGTAGQPGSAHPPSRCSRRARWAQDRHGACGPATNTHPDR